MILENNQFFYKNKKTYLPFPIYHEYHQVSNEFVQQKGLLLNFQHMYIYDEFSNIHPNSFFNNEIKSFDMNV